MITVSASQPFTAGRLAVALSYGIGSAAVLYVLMLGGRRLAAPLARRGPGLQIAMGAVMVVVALAMLGEYDIKFQNRIASDLPAFLVNPSNGLEDTAAAREALADVRGEEAHGVGGRAANDEAEPTRGDGSSGRERPGPASGLPTYGPAPEFVDNQHWFNTPGDRPLTLRGLRGRVVLIDFWTYSCINCLRTLPYLKAWDRRYRKDGLTIVGVHSPEFPFEKDAGNVEEAIERNGISLPGRPGQRPGDLERLGQPVLAGRVLRRRPREGALRPLRRGRIRRERARDPRAARRSRPPRRRRRRPGRTGSRPRPA